MFSSVKPIKKRPVYFECHNDGYWCSVDGVPEYFKTKHEMYLFACEDDREIIEITHENEAELRASGAFRPEFD
ncbi:hypothetical protein [Vibrio rumoiensis]|uniref:hypothetical protein n=1 Tax=Vibrio rumoiensis TaxID=76258 RepID=UPI000B5CB2FA|nr:hypothetical protein [Vibrio rumoiensis]